MSFLKPQNKERLRQSAKLPKLPIQQQLQNNEIIERMNRKISFTKNQRHLGSTITYNDALNSNNTVKQFVHTGSKTLSSNNQKFRSVPEQIVFNHFELHRVYESQIKLINESQHLQRVKITPLSKKEFAIYNVEYPKSDSGDIAPGMAVTITVRFKPSNLGDLQDQIVVIFNGGTIRIPIIAMRQRPNIQWVKAIDCGHCWVGNKTQQSIDIKNTGGEAQYYLLQANKDSKLNTSQLNSLEEHFSLGPFTIFPTVLNFASESSVTLSVTFTPESASNFVQTITFKSTQGEQQQVQIRLRGGAYNAQVILEKVNGETLKQHGAENNVWITGTEINRISKAQVTVKNLAVVDVDYFWYVSSDTLQSSSNGNQGHSEHIQVQNNRVMSISPEKGKLSASSDANFSIEFLPKTRRPQSVRIELYLFNLPEKSLISKTQTKVINGIEAIQCLSLNVRTRPTQSELSVHPLHKLVNQKIYKGVPVKESFCIENTSESERKFKISLISVSSTFCEADLLSQREGTLSKGEKRSICVQLKINELSREEQRAWFLVEFDNGPSKVVSVGGRVEYPEVELSESEIFYGLCRTYTKVTKQLVVTNPQQSAVQFKVGNSLQYYELDFYEFYDFDEESTELFKKKRLTVVHNGVPISADSILTIQPMSSVTLSLEYNTTLPGSISEQISIQVVNGRLYRIPVILTVQEVKLSISRDEINLRHIYKGNVYNSNKFLSKELSIQNLSLIETTFEFEEISQSHCLIKVEPMKFTLKPLEKKRLDLVIEPIRTGEWEQQLKWKYFDNFKLNPQEYPELQKNTCFNLNYDNNSSNFIHSQSLILKAEIKGIEIKYYIKDESRARKVRQKMEEMTQSVKHSTMSFKSSRTGFHHEQEKTVYPFLEEVNFYNCEINQVRQLEIIIENDSGLTTEYNIYAEQYHTLEKVETSSGRNRGQLEDEEAFTSEMGKTFLQTRKLDKSQKVHLSNNKGISIMCDPPSGILHKKQSQKIVVTMFNDTSGRFRDFLVIDVKDHESKRFPIDIHVKGTPVVLSKNQLGIDFAQEVPMMKVGAVIVDGENLRKTVKVVNKGPKEVNLVWKVYPHNKKDNQQHAFDIKIGQPSPGTSNLVELKWNAIQPSPEPNPIFAIEPRQKTLKGREEFSFTLVVDKLKQLGTYENLLICEPELRDHDRKVKMQNLALVVEAECVEPKLTMDVAHKNQLNVMELFATEHINKESETSATNHLRTIKLKNLLKTNLDFEVSIRSPTSQQPFKIVSINTNSPITPYDPTKTFVNGKRFTLAYDSFVQVTIQLKGNKKDLKDWPMEAKTRKSSDLLVLFSNGSSQTVPLVGWLYRPWIDIQMHNELLHSVENMTIDFGTIHVKNEKKLSIYLINCSKSDAKFSIEYVKYMESKKINFEQSLWTKEDFEDQKITDQKDIFFLNRAAGTILSNSAPVHYIPGTLALPSQEDSFTQKHKPVKIDFLFKPKTNLLYKSKFRIIVEDGLSYDIIVRGRGSFEEELQQK